MSQRRINISEPVTGEVEWQAVQEPIYSGWLTQGPKVAAFETQFGEYHGVQHSLATTSCTTALHLILHAMGIGSGDEVIVPAFSWVASANVILYCGATPVFVDVETDTYNIDPKQVSKHITDRTKAVMVVHLFGLCANIKEIRDNIPADIRIIEDAACAAGATYNGSFAGGLGDAAAFSFHPRKTITTGEGGMITTNDKQLADTMQKLRNHGAEISEEQRHQGPKPYLLPDFNMLGFNYRMTDLQGAVGIAQLSKLPALINERRQFADYYRNKLNSIDWLEMPVIPELSEPAWQAFVTVVNPSKAPKLRNDIMEILQQKGIATRPGTHAIHMLNFYAEKFGLLAEDFPNAHYCNDQTMAIPLHNKMNFNDLDFIIKTLKEI